MTPAKARKMAVEHSACTLIAGRMARMKAAQLEARKRALEVMIRAEIMDELKGMAHE